MRSIVFSIVCIVGAIIALTHFGARKMTSNVEKHVEKLAQELTTKPTGHPDLQLIRASSSGKRLQADYRLPQSAAELNLATLHNTLSTRHTATCHDKKTQIAMKMGAEYAFDYYDKNQIKVARYTLSKINCTSSDSRITAQPLAIPAAALAPPAAPTPVDALQAAVDEAATDYRDDTLALRDIQARAQNYQNNGMTPGNAAKLAVADYAQAHPR